MSLATAWPSWSAFEHNSSLSSKHSFVIIQNVAIIAFSLTQAEGCVTGMAAKMFLVAGRVSVFGVAGVGRMRCFGGGRMAASDVVLEVCQ